MAVSAPLSITLLFLTFLISQTRAQSPTAPAPSPPGPVNLTAILVQGGQYNTFIRLLNESRLIEQLDNQLNNTPQGLTIFSPTDNAFNSLKAGALNSLNEQQKIQLLLYHVIPRFYTLSQLLTVSNPVSTQGSGDSGSWGLNFTGQGNQVNVSTGVVTVPLNNVLRQQSPLGVYEVNQVLLPEELFGNKISTTPKKPAPAPEKPTSGDNTTADAASPPSNDKGAGVKSEVGIMGLLIGVISLISYGLIS